MSKKNKNPNIINVRESIELFKAYSIQADILNDWTLRLHDIETDHMWDWYHTTGTLMRHSNKQWNKQVSFTDPEELASFIRNWEDTNT